MIVFAALCIIPLIAVISVSLTDEMSIVRSGYSLLPRKFSTQAYEFVVRSPKQILRSYFVSASATAIGTTASLLVVALLAFPLSRPDYKYGRPLTFYVLFTMLFSGGLIPTYMVVKGLGLINSLWALILPGLMSVWIILVLISFFLLPLLATIF